MELKTLIQNLPNNYRSKLFGNLDSNLNFYHIILSANDFEIFDEGILFICNYSHESDKKYHGNVIFTNTPNDACIGENLYLKINCDIKDFYLLLLDILKEYKIFVKAKEELTNLITNPIPLQTILDKAYQYLKNPIVLLNIGYEVLASAPIISGGPSLETKNNYFTLKPEALQALNDEDIPKKLQLNHGAFQIYSHVRNSNLMLCRISFNQYIPCFLYMRETKNVFKNFDLEYMNFLGKILQIELQKDSHVKDSPFRLQGLFLYNLLEKRQQNVSEITAQLHKFDCLTTNPFQVLTLSSDNLTNPRTAVSYVLQLSEILAHSLGVFYENRIVCLLTKSLSNIENIKLINFINYNKCLASISVPFRDILQISQYYHQTLHYLGHYDEATNEYKLIYCTNHLPELLFRYCISDDALKTLIHPDLEILREFDLQYNTAYLETLCAWLNNMRNQHQTAEALFVHKSTISYRLLKIEEILHVKLNNEYNLFSYELSYRIMKYLNLIDS